FTKWVPYDSWFAEQQRIQKQGGKILKVELCAGRQQDNVGL
ncbi:MAG: photosystem I reaction center subunit XII, partial [Cyanobacteria bacterium MAG APA_bin_95]|nr:photosystem I reaction center subunit XII [Cyanobacteria bacterium MAG APA_bin_95]